MSARYGGVVRPPTRTLASAFDPKARAAAAGAEAAEEPVAAKVESVTTAATKEAKPRKPKRGPSTTKPKGRQQRTKTKTTKVETAANGSTAAAAKPRAVKKAASDVSDSIITLDRVVYLPEDVRDALAVACAEQQRTRTQIVLDAIQATHTMLEDLVEDDVQPTVVPGDLWDTVVAPSRRNQPPKRQVFIRPTIAQVRVIDRLITEAGARDRSHLITVALRHHLGLA